MKAELFFQPSEPLTMHSSTNLIPAPRSTFGQPHPALKPPTDNAAVRLGHIKAIGEMLAGLINDETALYAITHEWRYDAAGRKFIRLHVLLDEQFSEIGTRLTRLAERSRELGAWNSTGHGDRAAQPRTVVASDALQIHVLRELLGLHEALIDGLKRGSALAGGQFYDHGTTDLLAGLAANHEKDAFMLRALLWEVQNPVA
jgi:starvation-inducible DNA-binding protein